jgi:Fe-S-cluster containining protein
MAPFNTLAWSCRSVNIDPKSFLRRRIVNIASKKVYPTYDFADNLWRCMNCGDTCCEGPVSNHMCSKFSISTVDFPEVFKEGKCVSCGDVVNNSVHVCTTPKFFTSVFDITDVVDSFKSLSEKTIYDKAYKMATKESRMYPNRVVTVFSHPEK